MTAEALSGHPDSNPSQPNPPTGRWLTPEQATEYAALRAAERHRTRKRELRRDNPAGRGPEIVSILFRMLPRLPEHIDFGGVDAADIHALRRLLAAAELAAIAKLRQDGESFTYIGTVLGVSRQSVHERWARHSREPPPGGGRVTGGEPQ